MTTACVDAPHIFDEPDDHQLPSLRRLCAACPLATECYRDAMADPDAIGFRAGTTQGQRENVRRGLVGTSSRRSRFCSLCGAPKPPGAGRRYCPDPCAGIVRKRSRNASAARRASRAAPTI